MERQAGEALECCKQNLMDNDGESLTDQNDDRNENTKDYTHEVSDGNDESIENWTRGHSCYILAKNSAALGHAMRLCEAE